MPKGAGTCTGRQGPQRQAAVPRACQDEPPLTRDLRVENLVRVRKHSPAVGAEPEVLARLAAECDLVVAGIGD